MSNQVVLTEKVILEKSRASSLQEVRRLNLWGEGFTDVNIIRELQNVEVIAMASNQISSLQPFTQCRNLEELYLRKNNVSNLREVAALSGLRKLHTLWLMDNPCAKHPYYREFILHCCLRLKHLDETEVTADERASAAHRLSPRVLDEILERVPVTSANNVQSNQNIANEAAAAPLRSNNYANGRGSENVSRARVSGELSGNTAENQYNNNNNNNNNNINYGNNNDNGGINCYAQNYAQVPSPPPLTNSPQYLTSQIYNNNNNNNNNNNVNNNNEICNNEMNDNMGHGGGQTGLDEDEVGSVGTVVFTTVQAQRAMLTAIVSLLPELTMESLELLRHEVSDRIERIRSQLS